MRTCVLTSSGSRSATSWGDARPGPADEGCVWSVGDSPVRVLAEPIRYEFGDAPLRLTAEKDFGHQAHVE